MVAADLERLRAIRRGQYTPTRTSRAPTRAPTTTSTPAALRGIRQGVMPPPRPKSSITGAAERYRQGRQQEQAKPKGKSLFRQLYEAGQSLPQVGLFAAEAAVDAGRAALRGATNYDLGPIQVQGYRPEAQGLKHYPALNEIPRSMGHSLETAYREGLSLLPEGLAENRVAQELAGGFGTTGLVLGPEERAEAVRARPLHETRTAVESGQTVPYFIEHGGNLALVGGLASAGLGAGVRFAGRGAVRAATRAGAATTAAETARAAVAPALRTQGARAAQPLVGEYQAALRAAERATRQAERRGATAGQIGRARTAVRRVTLLADQMSAAPMLGPAAVPWNFARGVTGAGVRPRAATGFGRAVTEAGERLGARVPGGLLGPEGRAANLIERGRFYRGMMDAETATARGSGGIQAGHAQVRNIADPIARRWGLSEVDAEGRALPGTELVVKGFYAYRQGVQAVDPTGTIRAELEAQRAQGKRVAPLSAMLANTEAFFGLDPVVASIAQRFADDHPSILPDEKARMDQAYDTVALARTARHGDPEFGGPGWTDYPSPELVAQRQENVGGTGVLGVARRRVEQVGQRRVERATRSRDVQQEYVDRLEAEQQAAAAGMPAPVGRAELGEVRTQQRLETQLTETNRVLDENYDTLIEMTPEVLADLDADIDRAAGVAGRRAEQAIPAAGMEDRARARVNRATTRAEAAEQVISEAAVAPDTPMGRQEVTVQDVRQVRRTARRAAAEMADDLNAQAGQYDTPAMPRPRTTRVGGARQRVWVAERGGIPGGAEGALGGVMGGEQVGTRPVGDADWNAVFPEGAKDRRWQWLNREGYTQPGRGIEADLYAEQLSARTNRDWTPEEAVEWWIDQTMLARRLEAYARTGRGAVPPELRSPDALENYVWEHQGTERQIMADINDMEFGVSSLYEEFDPELAAADVGLAGDEAVGQAYANASAALGSDVAAAAAHRQSQIDAGVPTAERTRAHRPGWEELNEQERRLYELMVAEDALTGRRERRERATGAVTEVAGRVARRQGAQLGRAQQRVGTAEHIADLGERRAGRLAGRIGEREALIEDIYGRVGRSADAARRNHAVVTSRLRRERRVLARRNGAVAREVDALNANLEALTRDVQAQPAKYRPILKLGQELQRQLEEMAVGLARSGDWTSAQAIANTMGDVPIAMAQLVDSGAIVSIDYLPGGTLVRPAPGSAGRARQRRAAGGAPRKLRTEHQRETVIIDLTPAVQIELDVREFTQWSRNATHRQMVIQGHGKIASQLIDDLPDITEESSRAEVSAGLELIDEYMAGRKMVKAKLQDGERAARVDQFGELDADIWVPEWVQKAFDRHYKRTGRRPVWSLEDTPGGKGLAALDIANTVIKLGLLAFKPAWQAGNMVGNAILLTTAGGISPLQLTNRLQLAFEAYQDYKHGRDNPYIDTDTTSYLLGDIVRLEMELYGELDIMQENPNQSFTEIWERVHHGDLRVTGRGARARIAPPGEGRLKRAGIGSFQFNAFMDNMSRMALFIDLVEKDKARGLHATRLDPILAEQYLQHALKTVGNFTRMTPWERRYVRTVIPFWAWIRHITLLSTRLPLTHPGRVAFTLHLAQLGAPEGLSDATYKTRGAIPLSGNRWLNFNYLNPFAGGIPTNLWELDVGNPLTIPAQVLAENVTPAIELPLEAATGYTLGGPGLIRPVGNDPRDVYLDAEGREQAARPLLTDPGALFNRVRKLAPLPSSILETAEGFQGAGPAWTRPLTAVGGFLSDPTGMRPNEGGPVAVYETGEPVQFQGNRWQGQVTPRTRANRAAPLIGSIFGVRPPEYVDVQAVERRKREREQRRGG